MPEDQEYDGSTMLTGPYAVMREAFVDNIIANIVQYKAYKQAGYKPKNDRQAEANSSRLIRNDKVKARLAYRRAELAKKTEITEEKQIKRFQALSEGAEKKGQYSAAVSAEDRITTICGLYSKDNEQKRESIFDILAAAMVRRRGVEVPLLDGERA